MELHIDIDVQMYTHDFFIRKKKQNSGATAARLCCQVKTTNWKFFFKMSYSALYVVFIEKKIKIRWQTEKITLFFLNKQIVKNDIFNNN